MRVYLDNELLLSLDPPARYFSSPHWYTGGYLAYPSGAEEETEGKYCHWEKPPPGEADPYWLELQQSSWPLRDAIKCFAEITEEVALHLKREAIRREHYVGWDGKEGLMPFASGRRPSSRSAPSGSPRRGASPGMGRFRGSADTPHD
jgi:hypothetical protein